MQRLQKQNKSAIVWWKHGALVALGVFMLLWASAGASLAGEVVDVTFEQAKALLEKKEPVRIIDLRTPGEFSRGKIPGAVNVDVYDPDFKSIIAAMAKEGNTPWLVYCRTGNRSKQVLPVLQKHHTGMVYHLFEGIRSWQGPLE